MKLNKFDEIWNSANLLSQVTSGLLSDPKILLLWQRYLTKKNNNNNLALAQHTFLYISLTLFCTTTMWNFLAHFMLENVVCAHRCFVVFQFIFFFYSVAHFHLVGRLFSFSHRHFHVFPPTKCVPCFLSNASALLLMSLKTLKFSRTWLCFWFFSLLRPDGLSLSKNSGWT